MSGRKFENLVQEISDVDRVSDREMQKRRRRRRGRSERAGHREHERRDHDRVVERW